MKYSQILSYKLVMPYILLVGVPLLYFLLNNLQMSFQNESAQFTFENYREVFRAPLTAKIFLNTALWVLGSVGGQFLLGLCVALLLHAIPFGQAFYRSIILILPWVTLDIVAAVSWKWMYNDLYGVFNDLLLRLQIIEQPVSWLGSKNMALFSVILANIWKGFSLCGLFILARLQNIPVSLYEAAKIDGANTLQCFFRITLPQIRIVCLSTLMLMVIWTINYFPLIFIMTSGGPNFATETVVTYIYRLRFRFFEEGSAAALSNILFLVILTISMIFLQYIAKEAKE